MTDCTHNVGCEAACSSTADILLHFFDWHRNEIHHGTNYKETYTILLEDVNRQRHTVKVDIPKFLEDKFLYIGGNKKVIKKQSLLLPVTKTDADTVQIVTNYNKMFIRRVDTKSVSSVERFKKVLKDSDDLKRFFVFGSTITTNVDYVTTIEYDELSKIFITFKTDSCTISGC